MPSARSFWSGILLIARLISVQDREYTREFEAETTRIVEELQEELESVVRPL